MMKADVDYIVELGTEIARLRRLLQSAEECFVESNVLLRKEITRLHGERDELVLGSKMNRRMLEALRGIATGSCKHSREGLIVGRAQCTDPDCHACIARSVLDEHKELDRKLKELAS